MNFATIEKCGKFTRAVLSFSYFFFLLEKNDELEILLYVLGTPHNKER